MLPRTLAFASQSHGIADDAAAVLASVATISSSKKCNWRCDGPGIGPNHTFRGLTITNAPAQYHHRLRGPIGEMTEILRPLEEHHAAGAQERPAMAMLIDAHIAWPGLSRAHPETGCRYTGEILYAKVGSHGEVLAGHA